MNPFQTKKFNELRNKWYKKLKQSGFDDIENDKELLTVWHSTHFIKRHKTNKYQEKEEYYQLSNKFLHEFKFQTKIQKNIWAMHSEGSSIRDIAKKFNRKIWQIHRIIKSLKSKMLKSL